MWEKEIQIVNLRSSRIEPSDVDSSLYRAFDGCKCLEALIKSCKHHQRSKKVVSKRSEELNPVEGWHGAAP